MRAGINELTVKTFLLPKKVYIYLRRRRRWVKKLFIRGELFQKVNYDFVRIPPSINFATLLNPPPEFVLMK